ncbi:MAG: winged helix-turn-helix transcriptional regulator [Candidatus Helarchaeota archaeon]|nr:winged helix-turn-helix transcriptional regulator [Candidatus Helarchaeota archaeon]
MTIDTAKKSYHLTEFEERVLSIIKEILKKHIVFQFDATFIDFCLQKLKVSEMEIYSAIYSLLRRKLIVPGSTLTREQILENPSRTLIFETIQKHPGIHIRELCTTLNMSSGVVRTHLKVLENFNYIRRKKYTTPKFVLLFLKDFPQTYDDFFLISKNENDQHIIQCLTNTQLTMTDLSSRLGLHHSTVQYHLKKLGHLDFIIPIEEKNIIKYTFNKARLGALREFLDAF